MNDIALFGIPVPAWGYVPIVYFLWVSIFLSLKKILYRWTGKTAHKTSSRLDDIFFEALDLPLTLGIFVSGALILERISAVNGRYSVSPYFVTVSKAAVIIAIVLFLDKFLKNLVRLYAKSVDILRGSSDIVQVVVRAVIIGMGALILLDSLGISVTPLIASLGIGSLAVALGLQPTLENFFAGIQIVIDRPIMEGHFVRLESGEEGYVEKIGWRSTWIRMLPNNMIIVPNKVLFASKIMNFYYPQTELAVLVEVGVSYGSDLKHVEKITTEVAEEVLKSVAGGVPEFKPFIRYHTFNNSSIDFTVILRAKEFTDQYLIKHEFIKRLHERYQKEGIVIPYPLRTLELSPQTLEAVQTLLKNP